MEPEEVRYLGAECHFGLEYSSAPAAQHGSAID